MPSKSQEEWMQELLGDDAPKRKRGRKSARHSVTAAVVAAGYIPPGRGGDRSRKVRVPHLGELTEIRDEMLRLYRHARQNLGDALDASDARALAGILKSMADIRSVEIGVDLGELQRLLEERLPDNGKARR